MSKIFKTPSSRRTPVAALHAHPAQSTRAKLRDVRSQPRELANRSDDGMEVTLLWDAAGDELTVCVCDQREGAYFEIRPEHHLALDVYYHPYAYAASSVLHYQDDRLVA
jgi:hypothetical protein